MSDNSFHYSREIKKNKWRKAFYEYKKQKADSKPQPPPLCLSPPPSPLNNTVNEPMVSPSPTSTFTPKPSKNPPPSPLRYMEPITNPFSKLTLTVKETNMVELPPLCISKYQEIGDIDTYNIFNAQTKQPIVEDLDVKDNECVDVEEDESIHIEEKIPSSPSSTMSQEEINNQKLDNSLDNIVSQYKKQISQYGKKLPKAKPKKYKWSRW